MEAVSHGSQHSSEGVSDRGRCIVLVVRLLDGEAMTHDPLCPDADPNGWVSLDFNGNSFSCRCEEYARVREDERMQILAGAGLTLDQAITALKEISNGS